MSVTDKQVRELITEQAADWFVANRARLTEQERVEFPAWLQASPAHVEEYLSIATVSRDLRAACYDPENSIDQILARAQSSERVRQSIWPRTESAVSKTPAPWWPRAAVTSAAMAIACFGL